MTASRSRGCSTIATGVSAAGRPCARSTIRPRFSVNTAEAVMEAAAAGLGIARVMSYQAADAISSRRVRVVLREFANDPMPVNLVHQPQRVQPLKQRAFLDFVVPRLHLALADVERAVRDLEQEAVLF